jgi:hypothetical protein
VQFDWTRILKDPAPAETPRRESREPRDGRERRREPRPQIRPQDTRPAEYHRSADTRTIESAAESAAESASEYAEYAESGEPGEAREPLDAPESASSYVAEAVAQLESAPGSEDSPVETPDVPSSHSAYSADSAASNSAYSEAADSVTSDPAYSAADATAESAARQRLGAEGLGRLRARYAEVMARIAEQPLDEDAREQLKERAERLNPDGWVTADEVTAALEQYETVFEQLRAVIVVGREPRRRRRR